MTRLESVFKLIGERPEGVECKAILGIIAEGDEVIEEFSGGEALDAGLISAAQAVEHLRSLPSSMPLRPLGIGGASVWR